MKGDIRSTGDLDGGDPDHGIVDAVPFPIVGEQQFLRLRVSSRGSLSGMGIVVLRGMSPGPNRSIAHSIDFVDSM